MKIISIDCETDGLYGGVWAIGAVCWDDSRQNPITSVYAGRTPIRFPFVIEPWVLENVAPHCGDLPEHEFSYDLFADFARWWKANREQGAIVIADIGVPVEARLWRDLVIGGHLDAFRGPYPQHEVATMLLAAGVDPDVDRLEYADRAEHPGVTPHNPVHDAEVSLLCWLKAREVLGR